MSVRNENQDADHLVGQLLGERYRLIGPLGSGSSAHVYLADDLLLGRPVAVKCLKRGLRDDARFLRRFRAEAQAVAQLSHPNLLAVYDWGEDDAGAYLVTEVLLGGSLADLIEQPSLLTPSQGLLVALQVAYGLDYAHDLGWVHRDIKPANLLFGPEGRLRVADFGIATAVAEVLPPEPDGSLLGTARYAAPEQGDGSAVDGRADLYSLVLTIVEAVTGEVPLLADGALATMMLRQERDVGPLDELGPLGEALQPAGMADPAARPTAAELVERLTGAARTLPRPGRLPLVRHDLDPPVDRNEAVHELSDPEPEPEPGPVRPRILDLRDDDAPNGSPGRSGRQAPILANGPDDRGSTEERAARSGSSDAAGPQRRSSDQIAFEPIPRPAMASAPDDGLAEGSAAGSVRLDDREESLRLDEMTVIDRPPARLRPTQVPDSEQADAAPSAEPAVASSPAAAAAGITDTAPSQRTEEAKRPRRQGRRPAATSWLDNAKLDPVEPQLPDDVTDGVDGRHGAIPEPGRRGAHDLDAPDPGPRRRLRPSRLADPLQAETSEHAALPQDRLAAPGLDRHDESPGGRSLPPAGRGVPNRPRKPAGGAEPVDEVDGQRRSSIIDPGPVNLSRVIDDRHDVGEDDVGEDDVDTDDEFDPRYDDEFDTYHDSRRSYADEYDYGLGRARRGPLDDDDVFHSAERSARPPEPGLLEPPAPLRRLPERSSPLEGLVPPAVIEALRLRDPSARLAVAVVGGLAVLLLVAAVGLRVSGGGETEATAGSLGVPRSVDGTSGATQVGSYVGGTVDAARADAVANGWVLTTTRIWRDGTEPGEVLDQTPAAGSSLEPGEQLDVVVSQGPELVPIPPVVGRSAADAIELLGDAGLIVGTVTEVDSDAPAGEVIASAVQGPDPSANVVTSGAAIDLVLSARGEAEPMPSFVGLTVEQAIAQANDLGVELEQDSTDSVHWAVGLVADTDPPTDTPIRPGDTVTIFISTGPPAPAEQDGSN